MTQNPFLDPAREIVQGASDEEILNRGERSRLERMALKEQKDEQTRARDAERASLEREIKRYAGVIERFDDALEQAKQKGDRVALRRIAGEKGGHLRYYRGLVGRLSQYDTQEHSP